MFHSLAISVFATLVSIAWLVGGGVSSGTLWNLGGLSFAAVLIVGLPHGAHDFRLIDRAFGARFKTNGRLIALGAYVGLMLLVIAGWFLLPTLTICLFFALAAWHFGVEEDEWEAEGEQHARPFWLSLLGRLARGGMIIWLPCLFQTAAVGDILSTIVGGEMGSAKVRGVAEVCGLLWPLFTGALLLDLWYRPARGSEALQRVDSASWNSPQLIRVLRLICLAVLFAVVHPLISFSIYFCGWHSLIALRQMKRSYAGSTLGFTRSLLPLSLISIALALGAFALLLSVSTAPVALVRVLFVGLSSVAVPHIVLEFAAERAVLPAVAMQATESGKPPEETEGDAVRMSGTLIGNSASQLSIAPATRRRAVYSEEAQS